MMIHLAFTGTQCGMTPAQRQKFLDVLAGLCPVWFHHGDCTGADAQAHDHARMVCRIYVHPSDVYGKRAWCAGEIVDLPRQPLDRNRIMVDIGEALIACPKSMVEELRSGTWATIRYARKSHKPVHIIWPDGSYIPPPPS